ncbi:MAG: ATP synthase F1 subunit delta [Dehalococcoidales bacterium]|nr:ATP synthase F1 subunit delta [Dehalococcoidales bacterium]
MARKVYANRYSQAVFEIAMEKGELDRWQADLSRIARLAKETVLMAALENPKLHFNDKVRMVSQQLGDINPLALNLAYLLVSRGMLSRIGEIADGYQRLLDDYRGIESAVVTTTIPLDDEDKLSLEKRLGAIVGKKVVIKSEVDASLIGGIVARIGDKLLDGSIRSRLEALKRNMSGVAG